MVIKFFKESNLGVRDLGSSVGPLGWPDGPALSTNQVFHKKLAEA